MALGVIAYIKAYFAPDLEGSKLYRLFATWTAAIQLPLLAVIAGTGSLLIWRARANHSGTALLAFNIVLFVFALILIFKMPFLLIGWILVRTLHDAARFVAYIRHDTLSLTDE